MPKEGCRHGQKSFSVWATDRRNLELDDYGNACLNCANKGIKSKCKVCHTGIYYKNFKKKGEAR